MAVDCTFFLSRCVQCVAVSRKHSKCDVLRIDIKGNKFPSRGEGEGVANVQ